MRNLANKRGIRHLTGFLNSPFPFLSPSVRSLQTLAFEEIRSSKEALAPNFTAYILRGLLGSGRNWRSFSCNLVSSLAGSNWKVVLVNLRNHGKSADIKGLSPPHNMENVAKDLVDLIKEQVFAWPDAVLGHSMVGKVALQFAKRCWEAEYWDHLENPPNGIDIELVRGENSDRWNPDLIQRLEKLDESKANVKVHLLKNSGHWVHVDNPKGLLEIVTPKIASLALKSS